jgi:CheY-like chemotaxis protein
MSRDLTILTVDDNDAHRYFVCRTLEEAGFKAVPVQTGKQALEKAAEQPDLILLDVHLPDISGFEVCRGLKSNRQTANIPVVMFSAIAQDGSAVNDAKQLGAASFLFFPMGSDQLISVVQGVLSRNKNDQASEK